MTSPPSRARLRHPGPEELLWPVPSPHDKGNWNGYQPLREVDRAQMAVFIARSIAEPTGEAGLVDYVPPTTPDFPDADTDYWAYKHIEYCFEEGIVEGFPTGYYRPAWFVDRAQMAVYVQRAFRLPM